MKYVPVIRWELEEWLVDDCFGLLLNLALNFPDVLREKLIYRDNLGLFSEDAPQLPLLNFADLVLL